MLQDSKYASAVFAYSIHKETFSEKISAVYEQLSSRLKPVEYYEMK